MKKFLIATIVIIALGALFYFRDTILPGNGGKTLRITMNTEATDISPYALNLNNLTRTQNIYEGLVAFDRNLRVVPALAVSWGNVSDTEWEFRLREGVLFHDGSPLEAQDVVSTFQKAKNSGNDQITSYFDSIDKVSFSGSNRVMITTYEPDPLLLSKLTKLFVYRDGHIGTGPYKLDEWVPGDRFLLKVFSDYWGETPVYSKVRYDVVRNRLEREKSFSDGEIDILVGLTPEQALELPDDRVVSNYGLEVNFLMFQLDDPLLSDRSIREALLSLIDPEHIEGIGNDFVKRTGQFIAQGVFGYNREIPAFSYSFESEVTNLFGQRLERLGFDYLGSYQTLSEYLVQQFRKAGFSVRENASNPEDLLKQIQANKSQLFLIGWQAEDGDAGSFYEAFIHSDGSFNNGRYSNSRIDALIEASRTEMDRQKRLALLQQIGLELSRDLVGIPLFETSRIYGLKKGINWQPRLDGQVLAGEISNGK